MRKQSSFTLIEVLIVLIALAVLVAVGIPIYQNTVEKVRADICTSHLEALQEAVKIYEMKYDALPGSLAKAWHKYGQEALAIVWERKRGERDYIYLAYMSFQKFKYLLGNIFSINTVHAQPTFRSTLADKGILKCPSDYDPAGESYGIKSGKNIIGDCESNTINNSAILSRRHSIEGKDKKALFIIETGEIFCIDGGTAKKYKHKEGVDTSEEEAEFELNDNAAEGQ